MEEQNSGRITVLPCDASAVCWTLNVVVAEEERSSKKMDK